MRASLNSVGMVCALGATDGGLLDKLAAGFAGGIVASDEFSPGRVRAFAPVRLPLPEIELGEPRFMSRNNRLLLAALEPIRAEVDRAITRFGPDRVAVVVGTSTSGIQEAERAFAERRDQRLPDWFDYRQMEISAPSEFLARELEVWGPCLTISTACSSSAKALLSARRLIKLGMCDAAVAGGADTLSRFTVAGFEALEALSVERANPFSRRRSGINIGEGAALFLVSAEGGPVVLAGGGESSDAYGPSAPDPEGTGATLAMNLALADAGLEPDAIDYLNLHGTGTRQNDAMESIAVDRVFGRRVFASSTKPLTGHTLGAAGAIEAAFCWALLSERNRERHLPVHLYDGDYDPALPPLRLVERGDRAPRLERVMSNSFGFFGSNASLILEAAR